MEQNIQNPFQDLGPRQESQNPTLAYVQEKIDQILADKQYLLEAIDAVRHLEIAQPGLNALAVDTSRGDALSTIVSSREATHQEILRLLTRMYEDLHPRQENPTGSIDRFTRMMQSLSEAGVEIDEEYVFELAKMGMGKD